MFWKVLQRAALCFGEWVFQLLAIDLPLPLWFAMFSIIDLSASVREQWTGMLGPLKKYHQLCYVNAGWLPSISWSISTALKLSQEWFFSFSSSAESLKAFFRGQVALNELSVRQHLAMTNTTELLVAGEKKPYSYVYQGSAWQTSVLASLSIFCLSNIQSCLLAPEEHSESKAARTQTDSKGKAEEAANR